MVAQKKNMNIEMDTRIDANTEEHIKAEIERFEKNALD